ncbi:MAG TPA: N(2)-acetyl-L-2,4-diaminobutanoate deacetylase DoeB [Kiloniellales bacterium]|nr:N(2)-acetyl-L-2,4-diaminobutanoate deacetylase DoeB [Kiloniellales bacterium]
MTAKLRPSPISATVDYEKDGKQHGFLNLPWSRDDSAWGAIPLPITVVKRGKGPTALFTAGNHGDEYEGQVALHKLAQALKPENISGRVIILPALNFPAVQAGTRTSPIDKGNMNRVFPGRPDGTVTEKIADYVTRHLLPLADLVADLHSGGKTLEFVPFAACHLLPDDKSLEQRCIAAMESFGAPYAMTMLELDAVGMLDTTAEELGKVFVSTELAGGGTLTARSVAIADRGVRNLLTHAGILPGKVEKRGDSRRLDMPDGDCFVIGQDRGLIEPCADLGERVSKGQVIARIFDLERMDRAPAEYRAKRSGLLAGRHYPGLVKPGDCLAVVAVEL